MVFLTGALLLQLPAWAVSGFGVAGLAGIFLVRRRRPPLWLMAAAVAVCFSAVSLLLYEMLLIRPRLSHTQAPVAVRGTVIDRQLLGSGRLLTLWLDRQEMPKGLAGARVQVRTPLWVDAKIGDMVDYTLKLESDRMLTAAGFDFGAAAFYQPQIVGQERTAEGQLSLYREQIRGYLTALLPRGEGELLAAMLTGRTGGLSADRRALYARAGVSHLLAVSGMHLVVLTGLLELFLRAMRVSPRWRLLAQMAAAAGFMALTGFPYSVMRAGVMLLLACTAQLLGREADPLSSLGAAVTVILLANPYAALDVGLQLSYLATLGILGFSGRLAAFGLAHLPKSSSRLGERVQSGLVQAGSVTISANLLLLPLLCYYFGQLSLVAVVVNLLVVPLASIALPAGLLCALTGFVPALSAFSRLAGLVAGVSVRWMDAVTGWFGSLSMAAVPVREGYQLIWVTVVTGLLLVLFLRGVSGRVLVWTAEWSVCALLVAMLSHAVLWQDHFLLAAVPNGGATVICYGRQAAVIGVPDSDYELRGLEQMLADRKIETLPLVVAQKREQLESVYAARLLTHFSPEHTVVLEQTQGFEAKLFDGRMTMTEAGDAAVWMQTGGHLLVKDFEMRQQTADLLINGRNEIVTAPQWKHAAQDRYYGAVRVDVCSEHKGEDQ